MEPAIGIPQLLMKKLTYKSNENPPKFISRPTHYQYHFRKVEFYSVMFVGSQLCLKFYHFLIWLNDICCCRSWSVTGSHFQLIPNFANIFIIIVISHSLIFIYFFYQNIGIQNLLPIHLLVEFLCLLNGDSYFIVLCCCGEITCVRQTINHIYIF